MPGKSCVPTDWSLRAGTGLLPSLGASSQGRSPGVRGKQGLAPVCPPSCTNVDLGTIAPTGGVPPSSGQRINPSQLSGQSHKMAPLRSQCLQRVDGSLTSGVFYLFLLLYGVLSVSPWLSPSIKSWGSKTSSGGAPAGASREVTSPAQPLWPLLAWPGPSVVWLVAARTGPVAIPGHTALICSPTPAACSGSSVRFLHLTRRFSWCN